MTAALFASDVHPGVGGTGHDSPWFAVVLVATAFAMAGCYLRASSRLRRRQVAWPKAGDASFAAGCAFLILGGLAPFPFPDFSSHVVQHLFVGMVVPLLLILSRPVTLLLRGMRPGQLRSVVLTVTRWPVVSVLMFPPVAAAVNVGSLWVLYRTPLFSLTQHSAGLHALIHLHMLVAGVLLTAAVCQLDPVRHRYGIILRGACLVAAAAGHAVLAKSIYGSPPPGTTIATADLQHGAQLMYYGGDVVEVSLAVVLAVGWYRAARRQQRREIRRQSRPEDQSRTPPSTPATASGCRRPEGEG